MKLLEPIKKIHSGPKTSNYGYNGLSPRRNINDIPPRRLAISHKINPFLSQKLFLRLVLITILLFSAVVSFASAETEISPCRSTRGGNCVQLAQVSQNSTQSFYELLGLNPEAKPGDVFEGLYRLALSLVGVSAMIMIVIGGVLYMTARDSKSQTDQAKGYITNAVWGLIIALVSWLILYTINPDLVGRFNLNLTPLNLKVEPRAIPQGGIRSTTQQEQQRLQTDIAGSRQQLGNFTFDEISSSQEQRLQLENFQNQCVTSGGQARSTMERLGSTVRLYTCVK